jgi:hypothetical protein
MMLYKVLREHLGDKSYRRGDEREANPAEVAHLVASGVLVAAPVEAVAPVEPTVPAADTGDGGGAEPEAAAPENKALDVPEVKAGKAKAGA